MSAPKRDEDQRERDLAETSKLYRQGWTHQAIADKLCVTRQQIGYDLKVIHERWRAAAITDFKEYVLQELAKLDLVEAEAWKGWERSLQDAEKLTEKARPANKEEAAFAETLLSIEGQAGDPRFLKQVENCIQQRCKLLGLYAPDKIQLSGTVQVQEMMIDSRDEIPTLQELVRSGRLGALASDN